MNPLDWDRCKELFSEALALGPEERIPLLERACAGNPELRDRVSRMLDAAADDDSLLDVGAAEQLVGSPRVAAPLIAGDLVGRYRVLRLIGQGGTSLVYLAEHAGLHSPRRFAIKVIASAFLAGQRERFDRECEILAAFEHPNIARIVDAGSTATGWPYLAMDYIDGSPFHAYCHDNKLAPPEIVRLMLECCRAVQYIHGNLVVHCDLKPSNILVDRGGSPRILDFGIARLIEPDRKTRTGRTTRGIRPLSPNYASPEQLAGAPLTASTDIYSLGVVLYESLTGALPFDNPDYPWAQLSRHIAEQSPPLPSKARLKSGPSRENAAFAQQLRGDLDSIVLKTLAHDPRDRYASVDELSDDLHRYLAGDVVKARRSTWAERAGKLLRRHRRGAAELAVACLTVASVLGLSSWYAGLRMREHQARYVGELRDIVHSLVSTLPGELSEPARARAAKAAQLSGAIASLSPKVSQYPELVPDLAGALLTTAALLGNPYAASLGRLEEARADYRRAFELARGGGAPSAGLRAEACLGLGDTYSHPSLSRDPAEAARWYQAALRETSACIPECPGTAAFAHARLGAVYELLGDAGDADAHYRQARRLLPPRLDANTPVDSALGLALRAAIERPPVAAATYADALAALDRIPPSGLPDVRTWHAAIEAHLSLGLAELRFAHMPEAERQFSIAAELAEQAAARDPENLQALRELAIALHRRALVLATGGLSAASNALRRQATENLRMTAIAAAPAMIEESADPSCAESVERVGDGSSPSPLRAGDLLVANGKAGGLPGKLLVFSPQSLKMAALASGGYLTDMADVAVASRGEIYVVDRALSGSGGIVRLRHDAGRWLQKPVTCGGLLRQPAALAYHDGRLILVDADEYSSRILAVDPRSGRQTLLARTDTFARPGKIVAAAAGAWYLSLFWPGEGGPAEIVRFDARTRQFSFAARYGFLEDPVALAITPRGDLIAGDRDWSGNGGFGEILRIGQRASGGDPSQRVVCRKPELSRVTAVAAASEREAWYVAAAVPESSLPSSRTSLFHLDLITGDTAEVTVGEGILTAPTAIVRVD
jgi:tetratricopeptide (TPR) repeat protein/tRNA A-37 threonylcarbamoyl transferase component Bud32